MVAQRVVLMDGLSADRRAAQKVDSTGTTWAERSVAQKVVHWADSKAPTSVEHWAGQKVVWMDLTMVGLKAVHWVVRLVAMTEKH